MDKRDNGPKSLTYLLLTIVLAVTSYLSVMFVREYFGGGDVLISLSFLSAGAVTGLCALVLVYFLFDALRFFCILKSLKIDIGFGYLLKLVFINIFVSNITPFATGGGFAQVYFLTRKDVPLGKAVAASSIRTLLATAVLFVAAPAVLVTNKGLYERLDLSHSPVFWLVLIIFYGAIGTACFLVFKRVKTAKRVFYVFLKFLERCKILTHARMMRAYKAFSREVVNFRVCVGLFLKGGKRYIFLSALSTLLFLLALFLFPVLLTGAMGYHIPALQIIGVQTVVTFITYFAPTPGASGIAEGGFALIFSNMVGSGDVASLTLSWRFFSIYIGVIIGFLVFYTELFLSRRKRNKRR